MYSDELYEILRQSKVIEIRFPVEVGSKTQDNKYTSIISHLLTQSIKIVVSEVFDNFLDFNYKFTKLNQLT